MTQKNKKENPDSIKEYLEQEDYYDSEYIEKVSNKYGKLIGVFVIRFNELEHVINRAISKSFCDDEDSAGYRVVKLLNLNNKIDLFYEIYLELSTYDIGNIKKLKKIKNNLDSIRKFRNKLIHANWSTLDKKGYVRTKIESNKEDGAIQFVKAKILPKNIEQSIDEIDSLILEIEEYP